MALRRFYSKKLIRHNFKDYVREQPYINGTQPLLFNEAERAEIQLHREQVMLERKQIAKSALSLIQVEKDPKKIVKICEDAEYVDRMAMTKAISILKQSNDSSYWIDKIIDGRQNERSASHAIVLYGKAGFVSNAIKLFDQMPHWGIVRRVSTLNSLLFSCILAGAYGEMKRIFYEFPKKYSLPLNVETYNTLLKGLCESAGSADCAHSILADMEKKGIKPNYTTFVTMISGFYREEKVREVEKMMELMKKYGVETEITIYNVRIQSLCKLKRSAEAKALFDLILEPNWVTYYHLICGFCKEGKLDIAKSLFKEMIESGLKPEAECYFTLLHYLCEGRDFETALEICRDCMAKEWIPNITTMRSLLVGTMSIGKVDEANEIIRQVKEKSRHADRWVEMVEETLLPRE